MPWQMTVLEGGRSNSAVGEHVQRVEPAAGLVDVLDDEVGRVVLVEPLLVLERVVHLGERHRARLEPAVEHLGNAPHHRLAGGIVGVRARQFVDVGAVQVVGPDAEVGLEFVEAAVDVDARIVGVVARQTGIGEPQKRLRLIDQSRAPSSHLPKRPSLTCPGPS